MRQKRQRQVVHLSARITRARRNYFITRSAVEPPVIDDEATLELQAVVEKADANYEQHIGEDLEINLLSATRYDEPNSSTFDGSVILKGAQRSASAYLPPQPFWSIWGLLDSSSVVVRLQFVPSSSGHGSLVGLYIGEA
jgi:hypothetical protein